MKKIKELTDAQVKAEIEKLKKSPYVKLGRESKRLRQQLYGLKHLEKIGREIAEGEKNEKQA